MNRMGLATATLATSLTCLAGPAQNARDLANGDWRASRKLEPMGFTESLIDERASNRLRQKFDDMTRSYEWRERFSLTTLHDEEIRASQNSSFAMNAFNELQATHVERRLRQVTETQPGESITDASRASVAIAGTAAALYVGIPIRLRPTRESVLTIRSRAYTGTGSIELQNAEMVTAMSYSINPGDRTPGSALSDERIGLQASRPLPIAELTSGMTYGSTSGLVTASLSRPLLPNLALVGDSSHSLGAANVNKPAQERVSVLYQLSF